MGLREKGFFYLGGGDQRHKLVLPVDPPNAIADLYKEGRVPEAWFQTYTLRLLETKEADEVRLESITSGRDQTAEGTRQIPPALSLAP